MENREIRLGKLDTRPIYTHTQSNYYLIFDPTPFYPPPPPPVLFEIVQEALLLPPRVKLKMLLHRCKGGGAGIEIEGSAKTLKERPRC